MTAAASHFSTRSVESRIDDVGRHLASTFVRVLEAIPGGPHRPQMLARQLGLNTVLTSRLLRAANQSDPMAVAHIIPGPEPLRRLLHAAETKRVDRALIEEARAAVDRFQQLIDADGGDRSGLDAIISGCLPGAREKVELTAKQSVFRGASHLLGTACDVAHYTFILYPSKRGTSRADHVVITNLRGLRRVRPGATMHCDTVYANSPPMTIDGESVDSLRGLLLEQFCSSPIPQFEVSRQGDVVQYSLAGRDVGVRSAVDLVHATYLAENKQVTLQPGEDRGDHTAVMAIGVDPPCKVFILDVLVHEDIVPGQRPSLSIYRTAGTIGSRRPARTETDRLDVLESIDELGSGLAKFRCRDTAAYPEMIRHVCEKRDWDTDKLRGFRCRIDYPMYSSEVAFVFDLPGRDERAGV